MSGVRSSVGATKIERPSFLPAGGFCLKGQDSGKKTELSKMYGQNFQQSVHQPSMGANPVRAQLNRENEYFPFPARAREFGLARRVRPSRPASACSFSTLRLNLVLSHGIPPTFRDGVHLYHQQTSCQSRVSRVTKMRTDGVHCIVRRRRASSPQGSSSNGCCLFRYHHGPKNVRLSFPTPTTGKVCTW